MSFGEEVAEKKFRLKNKKIHLTYPDIINVNEIFDEINKREKIDLYSIVNEIGETGHKHTHFLIKFLNTFETTNNRFFDYKGYHPNIKKVSNNEHWINCVTYHKKQNIPLTNIVESQKIKSRTPKKKGIPDDCMDKLKCSVSAIRKNEACSLCTKIYWEKHNKETIPMGFKDLNSYNNLNEALDDRCQTNLNQATSIVSAWKFKPLIDHGPEPKVLWRPWQRELRNELLEKANDRSIIWYYDPPGSGGKSCFAEHMEKYYKAFTCDYADNKNLPTMINNWMIQGGNMNIIIIDLARTEIEPDEFYNTIEKIKNGKVSNKKYSSHKVDLATKPHIVIFANRLPRKEYEVSVKITEYDDILKKNVVRTITKMEPTLSSDRWDIRTLGRVKNDKSGKNEWIVVNREYNPITDDDEIPEGYFKPGQSVSTKSEEEEEYDFDDIFTE